MAVLLEAFNHPARPTLPLVIKTLDRLRRRSESNGRGLEADAPAAFYQRPSQDDIFADHSRPSLIRLYELPVESTAGALGHPRSLIERLLPLGRRDPGKVMPVLQ